MKEVLIMDGFFETQVSAAASVLGIQQGRIGVILGSGLGSYVDSLAIDSVLEYRDIPFAPVSTVTGHIGRFVAGHSTSGKDMLIMQGRVHGYEGYSAKDIARPIELMRALGTNILIITNAAGGVSQNLSVGDIMCIDDHINLTGLSPLSGGKLAFQKEMFVGMNDAYSSRLRNIADKAAASRSIPLKHGIYLSNLGPNYETPAEVEAMRRLGADAIGMSTVVECIAAHAIGMEVIGFSVISNYAAGISSTEPNDEEVKENGLASVPTLTALIQEIIASI